MEMENIKEHGRYTVTADVSGVDDLVASNGWVIRPDKITLVYCWWRDEPWKVHEARVSGGRVLSHGQTGKERAERTWYSTREHPAWLQQLVGRFRPSDRDTLSSESAHILRGP